MSPTNEERGPSPKEEEAERVLNAALALLSERASPDEKISASAVSSKAGVEPDRVMNYLFQWSAANALKFVRAEDGSPDLSFVVGV